MVPRLEFGNYQNMSFTLSLELSALSCFQAGTTNNENIIQKVFSDKILRKELH